MRRISSRVVASVFALGFASVMSGCSEPQISYKNDIMPILSANCLECHSAPNGDGYKASGLAMDSYQALMTGTKYGPVIVAGSSINSTLLRLVAGQAHTSLKMPHNRPSLSEKEQEKLRLWIEQGAKNN